MVIEKKKGRWKSGESGNPNGRPVGASDVGRLRTAIADQLPEIIGQLVNKAKEGDTQAARLLLERVLPPMKAIESMVRLEIPEGRGLTEQGQAIVRAVAAGVIAPGQGAALLTGLGSLSRLKEIDELEARILALEGAAK